MQSMTVLLYVHMSQVKSTLAYLFMIFYGPMYFYPSCCLLSMLNYFWWQFSMFIFDSCNEVLGSLCVEVQWNELRLFYKVERGLMNFYSNYFTRFVPLCTEEQSHLFNKRVYALIKYNLKWIFKHFCAYCPQIS